MLFALIFLCSITSYGDRPNTFADVSEYFRAHFIQVHRRNDIGRRALYAVRSYPYVIGFDILIISPSIFHLCSCVIFAYLV